MHLPASGHVDRAIFISAATTSLCGRLRLLSAASAKSDITVLIDDWFMLVFTLNRYIAANKPTNPSLESSVPLQHGTPMLLRFSTPAGSHLNLLIKRIELYMYICRPTRFNGPLGHMK